MHACAQTHTHAHTHTHTHTQWAAHTKNSNMGNSKEESSVHSVLICTQSTTDTPHSLEASAQILAVQGDPSIGWYCQRQQQKHEGCLPCLLCASILRVFAMQTLHQQVLCASTPCICITYWLDHGCRILPQYKDTKWSLRAILTWMATSGRSASALWQN